MDAANRECDSILGRGVYGFSEAARLIHVHPTRLRAWFKGRSAGRGPILRGDYEDVEFNQYSISFLDLIESLVATRLLDHGVSLIAIRKAYQELRAELNTTRPLSHKGLYTDGRTVFARVADDLCDRKLVDALRHQHVFPDVILPYAERIDYHSTTRLAERWRIMDGIVLDPARRCGKPIVDAAGISTSILTAAHRANAEDAELVADWYGVTPRDVELAVQFEKELSRKVA